MDPLRKTGEYADKLAEFEDRLRALEREYQTQRHELRIAYQDIHILKALQDVALELASILDPEPLLRRIVRSAMELMQAQGSSLLTLDKDKNELLFEVVDGEVSQQLVGRWLKVGEGVAGWVAQTGEPVLIKDAQNDPRFARSYDSSTGFRTETMICAPLIAHDHLLGVLSVVNKTSPGGFEPKDLTWLNALASLAAVAIENVNLYQRLRQERDRVVIAQEEVRKHLARDLHDGPTQTVAHAIMQADYIKKLLEHEPEKISEELDELREIGQRAIRQMRTMLFDLRPLILETQGLAAALRLYAERHQVEGVTRINLHVDDNLDRYNPRVESAAFSIVQEAVNNALKHAQAQNIWLRLGEKGDTLVVEVEDDGLGFDMESVLHAYENRGSLGMVSMRERAELIGGDLTLVSAVNQGTTVMLRVPVGTASTEGDE
jgi:signal transduction histidine kinase